MKAVTVKDVIINAHELGAQVMGDDFIGYKFVGTKSEFWNGVLYFMHENGEDIGRYLNTTWLNENNITYLNYDSNVWNEQ